MSAPGVTPAPEAVPAATVDARRLLCPLPILRAQGAMEGLRPGEVLAIRATDPGLHRDLPAWCKVQGHTLLGIREADGELVGLVAKGG